MTAADALSRHSLWRAVPSYEQEQLLAASRLRAHARGERLWSEGEPATELSFVARGRVKLVRPTGGGRDAIVHLVDAGQALCTAAACAGRRYCCNGVALEDCEVVSTEREVVLDIVARQPAAALELVRLLADRVLEACSRVDELAGGKAEQRIAKLLLRLAQRAGIDGAGSGLWVPVPLSRQDVADLCGTTLETAIRVLSRLRKRALVRTTPRGFFVLDRPALEAAVRGAEPAR